VFGPIRIVPGPGVVLALALVTASASALIHRHDRDERHHRAPVGAWPQAVALSAHGGGGEGTLIAPGWVMTAAHVAENKQLGQALAIGDTTYAIAEIIVHPDFSLRPIQHDLALLRLDRPVEGIVPARLYDGAAEVGMDVTFVGAGDQGTGLTGPVQRDRVRRVVTNRVTDSDSLWIRFRFDPPGEGLYHEGISGPGDSGGAAFVETDSVPWVIGVSSWQDTSPTERKQGLYGVIEHYTRVSTHLEWIRGVMEAAG
jgi:secreted trypsin-like serine protease